MEVTAGMSHTTTAREPVREQKPGVEPATALKIAYLLMISSRRRPR